MGMPDPRPTFAYLTTALRDKHPKLAYLHVTEPRVGGPIDLVPHPDGDNGFLREIWNGGEGGEERVFISAGGYTRETALRTAEDKGGLIAFGRLYISNVRVPALSFLCRALIHRMTTSLISLCGCVITYHLRLRTVQSTIYEET